MSRTGEIAAAVILSVFGVVFLGVAVVGLARTGREAWRPTTPGGSARMQQQIFRNALGQRGARWFGVGCIVCAAVLLAIMAFAR